jgi:hypothetical protein
MEPSLSTSMMGGQLDAAPLPIVLLILQVSPLLGSTDRDEFFYNPSPDICNGPIAAAHASFLAQGHEVLVLDCPDIARFQEAVHASGATLHPINDLPPCVFMKGYKKLQELAIAAALIATAEQDSAVPANPVIPEECKAFCTSLFECYADIPSVSLFAHSKAPSLPQGPPLFVSTTVGVCLLTSQSP